MNANPGTKCIQKLTRLAELESEKDRIRDEFRRRSAAIEIEYIALSVEGKSDLRLPLHHPREAEVLELIAARQGTVEDIAKILEIEAADVENITSSLFRSFRAEAK